MRPTNDSWRVDKTYIKVKRVWKYPYRAVGLEGNTLDFILSTKRDSKAAARFFRKALKGRHTQAPQVITVDQNAAYPAALETLKEEKTISNDIKPRQSKYLNHVIETQSYRKQSAVSRSATSIVSDKKVVQPKRS